MQKCLAQLVAGLLFICPSWAQEQSAYFPPLTEGDGQRYPLVLSPAIWSLLGNITVVPATDGKTHLAYVLRFTNQSQNNLTVQSIEVVSPYDNNKPVGTNRILASKNEDVTGEVLPFLFPTTLSAANYSRVLPAGQSAAIYFDVTFNNRQDVPDFLSHRITVTQADPAGGVKTYVTIDQPNVVDKRDPIILSPPLKGRRWLDGNGCCKEITPHRWVLSPINGDLKAAEMFAIDFVQLREDWRGFAGDKKAIGSYPFYGANIYNSAAGKVVEVVRDLPDELPGADPANPTALTAAGNHVIVDMGGSRYALYAHLAPHSPTVHVGDFVQKGFVLGKLGNSGNTDAPHLHFQVMDGPSALGAHGLPFVFDHMRRSYRATKGFAEESDEFSSGVPVSVAPTEHSGLFTNTMPLTFDVLLLAFESVRFY